MGIFDKAKDALGGHSDKVDQAIDKIADTVNERTGNQHTEQVNRGADLAAERIQDYLGGEQAAAGDARPVGEVNPGETTIAAGDIPGEPGVPPEPRVR